ncbi:MAG: transcription termination factor NusA [Desulfobacterales bacterium]
MFIADIKKVVEQISREKGIHREVLIRALEEALKSAARKKFGNNIDVETHYNEESGEIEVFQFKDVTEEVTDGELQMSLDEGRELDPECEIGDSLGSKLDTSTFGRIAAQSAKQVIIQKMKDAEREAVYKNYVDRKGEIINGIVQRIDRGNIIVNLGHTEGVLSGRDQVPREIYRRGDRIRALIIEVLRESRGPQIILSRTHPDFLVALFKTEVPEISEGIVTIMAANREPGVRAKIAVASNDSDIDPVGACVGMKGSRVQTVVQELRGEKIDIIPWHVDAAKYVCNALAPAEISRVIIDEDNRAMEVIVPDEFLSIAIGKRGQNVRLASKLTNWHLDVKSETSYSEAMQMAYDTLMALPGVSIGLADALYESGFYSVEELAKATVEDLEIIRELDETSAAELIAAAEQALEDAIAAEALEAEQAALAEDEFDEMEDSDQEMEIEAPGGEPAEFDDEAAADAEEATPDTEETAPNAEETTAGDGETETDAGERETNSGETEPDAEVSGWAGEGEALDPVPETAREPQADETEDADAPTTDDEDSQPPDGDK